MYRSCKNIDACRTMAVYSSGASLNLIKSESNSRVLSAIVSAMCEVFFLRIAIIGEIHMSSLNECRFFIVSTVFIEPEHQQWSVDRDRYMLQWLV